jgi:phosphotransferase system  glucose/maltose/N-acetylglucosamine-specific IIC component
MCGLITAATVGYLFLVWKWVSSMIWDVKIHNPQGLKDFIYGVLWSLLVIFATLFLEKVFSGKDD